MHDELLCVTPWNNISLSCFHIKTFRRKQIFLEGSRVWTCRMTAYENTEGRKPLLFCRRWFSKPFQGYNVEESTTNGLELFLGFFIIGIGGGVYHKARPVNRLFNTQGKIITLSCQGIILIVVHWSFHDNIIIRVKVLWRIILLVFLIGRIGCRWFCVTYRGC